MWPQHKTKEMKDTTKEIHDHQLRFPQTVKVTKNVYPRDIKHHV